MLSGCLVLTEMISPVRGLRSGGGPRTMGGRRQVKESRVKTREISCTLRPGNLSFKAKFMTFQKFRYITRNIHSRKEQNEKAWPGWTGLLLSFFRTTKPSVWVQNSQNISPDEFQKILVNDATLRKDDCLLNVAMSCTCMTILRHFFTQICTRCARIMEWKIFVAALFKRPTQ